jgi:hypothetical protein
LVSLDFTEIGIELKGWKKVVFSLENREREDRGRKEAAHRARGGEEHWSRSPESSGRR